MRSTNRGGLGLLATIVTLGMAIVGVLWWYSSQSMTMPVAPAASSSSTSAASSSASTPAASASTDCPEQFVQKDVSDPTLNRVVDGGVDATTPTGVAANILRAAGHSASVLWTYATSSARIANVPSVAKLTDNSKKCLSQDGQNLWYVLKGAISDPTRLLLGQASSSWFNSGWVNGKLVLASQAGITGNLKALLITLPDGTVAVVLVRCGNPVFPSNPGLPTGPTDNTPPPSTPTPTPTTSTPPPSTPTPTPQPKSTNPADYTGETGAPKASVTESARPAASVTTTNPAGGSVTDTPGSEVTVAQPTSSATTTTSTPTPATGANTDTTATACVPDPGQTSC